MRVKINERIPDPYEHTFGIFQKINLPVWNGKLDPVLLDKSFFDRFGERPAGRRLTKFDTTLTLPQLNVIAAMIKNEFGENWTRLFQTITSEYDPIENYNMTEHEDITVTGELDSTNDTNKDNKLYGFNSSTPVGDSASDDLITLDQDTKDITDRTLTRKGNIGVTTSTQMLEQHNTLWNSYNYVELIFKDVINFISLKLYD